MPAPRRHSHEIPFHGRPCRRFRARGGGVRPVASASSRPGPDQPAVDPRPRRRARGLAPRARRQGEVRRAGQGRHAARWQGLDARHPVRRFAERPQLPGRVGRPRHHGVRAPDRAHRAQGAQRPADHDHAPHHAGPGAHRRAVPARDPRGAEPPRHRAQGGGRFVPARRRRGGGRAARAADGIRGRRRRHRPVAGERRRRAEDDRAQVHRHRRGAAGHRHADPPGRPHPDDRAHEFHPRHRLGGERQPRRRDPVLHGQAGRRARGAEHPSDPVRQGGGRQGPARRSRERGEGRRKLLLLQGRDGHGVAQLGFAGHPAPAASAGRDVPQPRPGPRRRRRPLHAGERRLARRRRRQGHSPRQGRDHRGRAHEPPHHPHAPGEYGVLRQAHRSARRADGAGAPVRGGAARTRRRGGHGHAPQRLDRQVQDVGERRQAGRPLLARRGRRRGRRKGLPPRPRGALRRRADRLRHELRSRRSGQHFDPRRRALQLAHHLRERLRHGVSACDRGQARHPALAGRH